MEGGPLVCDEVIKEVELFCSNWMQQALLPQDRAVDNTPFVYNSLTMPGGASNHTWTQHSHLSGLYSLDAGHFVHREAGFLYSYMI